MKLVDYDFVNTAARRNGSACSRSGIPKSARCRADAMRRRTVCDDDRNRFIVHDACDGAPCESNSAVIVVRHGRVVGSVREERQ
jgi:hypothetical protein